MNPLKIDFSLFAGVLLIGTNLLARAATQGFEQALLSTAFDYCLKGLRAGKRLLPVS
jgi:hypothetical protein